MFGNLGFGEILLIALLALVLFGPQKLPEIGRALGRTIREFKESAREIMEAGPETPPAKPEPPKQPGTAPKAEEKPPGDRRLPD